MEFDDGVKDRGKGKDLRRESDGGERQVFLGGIFCLAVKLNLLSF